MKDVVRKGFLIGLGVTAMAASKIEKETKKFLKENDISQEEAEKAAKQHESGNYGHRTTIWRERKYFE